jgi:protein involved in polysaccharide export with SLBB domain
VTRPGSFALPEDRPVTLGDAISLAGGPLSNARVRSLTLLRQTPTGVERKIVRLDRAEGGLMPLNTEIVRTGDVIYLPEGKVSSSTMGLMNSFLPAASILLR